MALSLTSLKNLKVGFQVNAIAVLALVGFLVVGAVYFVSTQALEALRAQAATTRTEKALATEVQMNFLQARRHEKDFFLRFDPKYMQRHSDAVESAYKDLSKIAELDPTGENAKAIEVVKSKLVEYDSQFKQLAADWHTIGLSEEEGLRGALRKSVHEIEAKLNEFEDDGLTVKMLMMRRHEKDFMLRNNGKYIGRVADRAAEFREMLPESAVPFAEREGVAALLASYVADFNVLAALRLSIAEETKVLSELYAASEGPLEAIVAATDDEYAANDAAAQESNARTHAVIIGVIIVTTVAVLLLSLVIARAIARPILGMTEAMGRLAAGDKTVEIPGRDKRNEVGDMAEAVQVFKENMIEAERLAAEQKAAQDNQFERAKKLEEMTQAFEREVEEVMNTLVSATEELGATADQMASTAEETSNQSKAVAAASTQASANVQTVASATEELVASIREINQQVSHASSIADRAHDQGQAATGRIETLRVAADEIGSIVAMISEIAEKTNLLALNATIEAARAGETGKGFAVVADEVKQLASQTAKATDEIGRKIQEMQEGVETTVPAMQVIAETINELKQISAAVAAASEQQTAATQEISRNVQEAAIGTQEVSSNTSGLNEASQSTASAAEQVAATSKDMALKSDSLKRHINDYIVGTRAA